MPNQNLRIGISILTLFWIIFPFFPNYGKRLNQFCERTGLGLQLVPLWIMSVRDIEEINPENVISYEDRWDVNPSLLKTIRRIFFVWESGWNPFAIIEPMLFGTKLQGEERIRLFHERFSNAFGVDDKSSNHYLMETSPSNWDQVLEHIQSGGNICLDLYHIRNNDTSEYGFELGSQRLGILSNVELIHFQTRSYRELRSFIKLDIEWTWKYFGNERIKSEYWDFTWITYKSPKTFLNLAMETHFHSVFRNTKPVPIIIELKPCSSKTISDAVEKINEHRDRVSKIYQIS